MKQLLVLEQEDLDKIIQTIKVEIIKEFRLKNFVIEKPMSTSEAMEFLGYGKTKFARLVKKGIITGHRPDEESGPSYFPSELVAAIKLK